MSNALSGIIDLVKRFLQFLFCTSLIACAGGYAHINQQPTGGCETDSGVATIRRAILSRDAELLRAQVARGALLNCPDSDGLTPLKLAISKDSEASARYLIEHGANVNEMSFGSSPLHMAAVAGDSAIVKALLDKGARADVTDKVGMTPLKYAASVGNAEMTTQLLQHGAYVNNRSMGATALQYASYKGHVDVADILISMGADINIKTKEGFTAFAFACQQGHPEVAIFLLQHGSDTHIPESYIGVSGKAQNVLAHYFLQKHDLDGARRSFSTAQTYYDEATSNYDWEGTKALMQTVVEVGGVIIADYALAEAQRHANESTRQTARLLAAQLAFSETNTTAADHYHYRNVRIERALNESPFHYIVPSILAGVNASADERRRVAKMESKKYAALSRRMRSILECWNQKIDQEDINSCVNLASNSSE